jgi:hypothetical protein
MNMLSHLNRLHELEIVEAEAVDDVMALVVTSVVETRLDVQSAGLPACPGNLEVEEVVVLVVAAAKSSPWGVVGEVEVDGEVDK